LSWIARAGTTFGSSSDYNGLVGAITLSGGSAKVFTTCDRCIGSPMCILGSDAICDGIGSNAQDHNVYFALTSGLKFASSAFAQSFCNLVSLVVQMRPINFEEFTKDGSQRKPVPQENSTGVIVINTTTFVNSTYNRNFCYEMAFTT
jgi:hypothetical protein